MTPRGSLLFHSLTWHSYNTAALQHRASELHAQKDSSERAGSKLRKGQI